MRARLLVSLLGVLPWVPACGDDVDGGTLNPDMSAVPHGEFHNYVATRVLLPMSRSDYSVDLNGDGKPDNQLGEIVGLLATQGLVLQAPIDITVEQGDAVVLFSMQTIDPSLKSDTLATLTYFLGKPFGGMIERTDFGSYLFDGGCAKCPDFTGSGMFAVDTNIVPAQLIGTLKNGHYASDNPVTTKRPATLVVRLSLAAGMLADFIINGAHIEFDTGPDPVYGKPSLISGRISGSIKNEDVQKHIIPAIAVLLSDDLKSAAETEENKQKIRGLFDKGTCANPDGTMAKAGDDKIDPCEVANSGLIKVVLQPDVAIYDRSGNYAPDKANTNPDSVSVGLGFTAISGAFARP